MWTTFHLDFSAPSSHKTSLNGGNTIPIPRHIARHSRPTATGHLYTLAKA